MTVAVSRAKGAGAEAVICASTGNTAASAAAYAARAGMRGAVIVPEGKIAIGKLAQALMHGARVIALQGNFDQALDIVREIAQQASGRARQLGQPVPDRGSEDGGVRDPRRARSGARRARDPGRQRRQRDRAGGRASASAARRRSSTGSRPRARRRSYPVSRSPSPETVASAIRIGNPARWEEAMSVFTASRGRVAAVSDEQILDAYHLLASREGVFCEPASAASVAGILAYGLPGPPGGAAARERRLRAHRPRAQGPRHRAWQGPRGDQVRARPLGGRARRSSTSPRRSSLVSPGSASRHVVSDLRCGGDRHVSEHRPDRDRPLRRRPARAAQLRGLRGARGGGRAPLRGVRGPPRTRRRRRDDRLRRARAGRLGGAVRRLRPRARRGAQVPRPARRSPRRAAAALARDGRAAALGPLAASSPSPAAPLRLRARGYDPGELIAARCADLLGLPLARCLARRTDRRQVGRSRAERLAARPRIRATGPVPARVLLIDDVMTTGSTLAAAAAILRAAGCERVEGAVFAHTRWAGRLYTRRTI